MKTKKNKIGDAIKILATHISPLSCALVVLSVDGCFLSQEKAQVSLGQQVYQSRGVDNQSYAPYSDEEVTDEEQTDEEATDENIPEYTADKAVVYENTPECITYQEVAYENTPEYTTYQQVTDEEISDQEQTDEEVTDENIPEYTTYQEVTDENIPEYIAYQEVTDEANHLSEQTVWGQTNAQRTLPKTGGRQGQQPKIAEPFIAHSSTPNPSPVLVDNVESGKTKPYSRLGKSDQGVKGLNRNNQDIFLTRRENGDEDKLQNKGEYKNKKDERKGKNIIDQKPPNQVSTNTNSSNTVLSSEERVKKLKKDALELQLQITESMESIKKQVKNINKNLHKNLHKNLNILAIENEIKEKNDALKATHTYLHATNKQREIDGNKEMAPETQNEYIEIANKIQKIEQEILMLNLCKNLQALKQLEIECMCLDKTQTKLKNETEIAQIKRIESNEKIVSEIKEEYPKILCKIQKIQHEIKNSAKWQNYVESQWH